MKLKVLSTAGIVVLTMVTALPAQAGCSKGLFAQIACETGIISEGESRRWDKTHKDLGRPLDRLGARAVDKVVPGLGTAWQAQDEFRRLQERRNPPSRSPRIQAQFGNFCATPAGLFGPGPRNPIGSRCWADTWNGRVFGHVIR